MRLASADERLAAAIGEQIEAAGGTVSTSLERLAAGLALGVDELRHGVLELEYAGLIVARRHGNVVPVDELAVHARVELSAT
jgi:predicted amino acid racemase